jgi:hypothetical protein
MPRKPKEPTPNRLLESAYAIGDFEPRLGFLHLETDEGLIVLAINTTVAGELAKTLIDFMAIRQADYEDDLEEPANDA